MTESLPLTINVNSDLLDKFTQLKSISNKLEAQFNFHTLTANWYGDERQVLAIQLLLETPVSFKECQNGLKRLSASEVSVSHFSDDVFSCFNEGEQQLLCYIAITNSELDLLATQPKLLMGFIQVKIHKVLNLIAVQQSLSKI
ncbi:hypothetical protein [Colwellia sp. TT2012]|uniref:hypothetical protein n=1 Tax=Colwellia sp. TT2012 TaxID=1720342 RepID=UPI00070F3C36|nr:hypothetical protein [Colwellia sp. TT2012]